MLQNLKSLLRNTAVVGSLALVGCGPVTTGVDGGGQAGCPAGCPAMGDAQTPPQGTDEVVTAWLTKGEYKQWKCEPAVHAARSPSPHGRNRICNNTKVSSTAAGNYPAGSASVKELITTDGGTEIIGYAIGLKLADGASTGAGWYWYEKLDGAIAANGKGDKAGNEVMLCTGCHQGAGSDAQHSGRDFIYTRVP